MKKTKQSTEYHGGRIKNLVDAVIGYVKKHPEASNEDVHRALMQGAREEIPTLKGYGQKDPCFNCGRSMKISVYTADVGHALLLLAMAKAVREETRKGADFTHANRIHIDRLMGVSTSIKKRQSQLGYLGLIKPAASGRSGYWVITAWGWKALRGEAIPRSVKYWNRHLIERSPETTTLGDMMRTHREKIEQTIRRGRAVKISDHRSDFSGYDPAEWAEYAGVVDQATIFRS